MVKTNTTVQRQQQPQKSKTLTQPEAVQNVTKAKPSHRKGAKTELSKQAMLTLLAAVAESTELAEKERKQKAQLIYEQAEKKEKDTQRKKNEKAQHLKQVMDSLRQRGNVQRGERKQAAKKRAEIPKSEKSTAGGKQVRFV